MKDNDKINIEKENSQNTFKNDYEIKQVDQSNNEMQALRDEVALVKVKYKSYIIIAIVIFATINILAGFFAWLFVDNKMNINIEETIDNLASNWYETIAKGIRNDILTEYQRNHYLPDDYVSIGMYANLFARPAVVEVLSGTTYPTVRASGLIINSDGYVLTNAHVVTYKTIYHSGDINNPTQTIIHTIYPMVKTVVKDDSTQHSMTVVAYDTDLDLAILKFQTLPQDLDFVTFGSSDRISIGEEAAIIGNSLGLGITVSTGVISGNYDYSNIKMLQIDAITLEGNSGAGVFNIYCELIGIISFEVTSSSQAKSMSFAISIDEIKDFIDKTNNDEGLNISYNLSQNQNDS